MSYILFDDNSRYSLLPFTHTRAVADIRCGIYNMRERWEHLLRSKTDTLTENYLQPAYTSNHLPYILENVFGIEPNVANIYINGSVFGTAELVKSIAKLQSGEKLVQGDILIAAYTKGAIAFEDLEETTRDLKEILYEGSIRKLRKLWDIFSK
ncbi:MAG TPA: putative sugar nucleotidyl transferase, partial [Flavipsychrobacter sp.]|nr:putative sugar nucleotidyl transferase [Flavipsychrobacter sp.]